MELSLVTKKTYETVMDIIGSFLEEQGDSIKNTYYAMKKVNDSYEIVQRFPILLPAMVGMPPRTFLLTWILSHFSAIALKY